jgi:hypothetical protein
VGLDGALQQWAQALAADPWTRSWPVTLTGVVPVPEPTGWWLVEPGRDGGADGGPDGGPDGGGSLPVLDPGDGGWVLLAVSGGHPVDLLVELVPGGARLVSVLPGADHELVVL